MAGPTTKTTLTEMFNAEWINPVILDAAADFTVSAPYLNWKDLRGLGTVVGSFPIWVLDAHQDLGETTDITSEVLETTDTQITAVELGLRRDPTYVVLESSLVGAALFEYIVEDAARVLGIALEDDIVALFPSFSSSVGTSGSNLTLANMVEAQATIRIAGRKGQAVFVIDDQQALDYQSAQLAATSTTVNSFFRAAGDATNEYLGEFMMAPVWQTGLCDAANTNANKVGALFIDGSQPKAGALGGVLARDVQTDIWQDVVARDYKVVTTAKWGVGIIANTSGCKIVTDL